MLSFTKFNHIKYNKMFISTFTSRVFPTQLVKIGDKTEQLVRGGKDLFHIVPKAFDGIKQIGIIGWGSQGPAQAQNIRDTLINTNINVKIGLQKNSKSIESAKSCGFTEDNNTLGEMYSVIKESDLVLLLISDAAQAKLHPEIFLSLKKNATLGLSHGFLLGHLKNIGSEFPKDNNIIMVAPKGMGPSVRRLYEQGKTINGSGINSSFAIHQDINGLATDYAIGWGISIGSPYLFYTSMEMEYKSDIFGERGILLGGLHGLIEALYKRNIKYMNDEKAFRESAETITGPLTKIISHHGIRAVYDNLSSEKDKEIFKKIYKTAYYPAYEILEEIYDDVTCGNEHRSVINANKRHDNFPIGKIDGTDTWKTGEKVRSLRNTISTNHINPFSAGLYVATMMAQIDLLIAKGHCYSEVANESVIEATDSLTPYMHAKGVSYMVDNCSVTARLGSRKWAPRFDYIFTEQTFVNYDNNYINSKYDNIWNEFYNHKIHNVLNIIGKYRPPVDISVV